MTISLREGKKSRKDLVSGLILLWSSRSSDIMIKRKHMKHYESKLISNRVKYITAASPYYTTHDMKILLIMTVFQEENYHAFI